MQKQKLRVLFLSPYYKPDLGGIERVIEKLTTKYLKSPEIEAVGVMASHYRFPRRYTQKLKDYEIMDGGVEVFRVNSWPHAAIPFFSVPLVFFYPNEIKSIINTFKPNIIHWVGDGWFWGHYFSYIYKPENCKIIFSPSFHPLIRERAFLKPINRYLCKKIDLLHTISTKETKAVTQDYKVSKNKVKIIPWGIDVPQKIPIKNNSFKNETLKVICVGRLGHHKNQQFLVEVWAQAYTQFNKRAELTLIGKQEDRNSRAKLKRLVKNEGIESSVNFSGELSDQELIKVYQESHIFALFSQYEAFGVVFFEALSQGVPVLTHDVGTNTELLTKGTIIVPKYDKIQAVKQLIRLVNDDAYRTKLQSDGFKLAQKYDWENIIEIFISEYQKL